MILKKDVNIGAIIKEPGNSSKVKTGNWKTLKPEKDKNKCTNCGICWQFCPEGAIDTNFNINQNYCKGCGICARECVFKAIKMVKEEK